MSGETGISFYDKTNISDLEWPDTAYGQYAKNYLLPLLLTPSVEQYIDNVRTRLLMVTLDGVPLPVTVNDEEYGNSYVCSPYTHFVTYAREELVLLGNRPVEIMLGGLLSGMGWMLRRVHFNRVVQVNNWLVSTNLLPPVPPERLKQLVEVLQQRYPKHVVICRSLNEATTGPYLTVLREQGCKLIPSRQIYLLHGSGHQTAMSGDADERANGRTNQPISLENGATSAGYPISLPPVPAKARWLVKRDRALIAKQGYIVCDPREIGYEDTARIKELYDMLYIDKYSPCNPQLNERFIRTAIATGTLELHGLRKNGRLDAILGFFSRDGIMTAPLFGYDTSQPQKLGLYRMLSAVLIGIAEERSLLLHESSGVGQFKRNRGAVAELEVMAVYDRHLPLGVRVCWTLLEKLLYSIGVPIIQRLKL
nr:hypothetical protein [Paenibacillus sanguinis]